MSKKIPVVKTQLDFFFFFRFSAQDIISENRLTSQQGVMPSFGLVLLLCAVPAVEEALRRKRQSVKTSEKKGPHCANQSGLLQKHQTLGFIWSRDKTETAHLLLFF